MRVKAMYGIVAHGEVIGHSELESGDPPMGVAFGRFFPAAGFDAFVRTVPPDEAEGDEVLIWNALSATSPEGVVIDCAGVAVFCYALGDEVDLEVTVLGISSPPYGKLFPNRVDASGDRATQDRSNWTSLAGLGPSAYSPLHEARRLA
ncbi:hypothetical protein [Methylobacterium bullatum]|uniref:Uncharacterized protein n=1 Tax=Methylobacterium bullatum TaxID=570505 RepID=A0A679KFV2_9HYPH|nr:hypothetical protein MBLL_02855 [Methylobacterium bullatum]